MTPGPWTFALLALAAFRVYRAVARDTVSEPLRAALTYPDGEAVTLGHQELAPGYEGRGKPLRVWASTLIRCPWCLGFYVSVGVYVAWRLEPGWALTLAAPLAVSAAVGFLGKIDAKL